MYARNLLRSAIAPLLAAIALILSAPDAHAQKRGPLTIDNNTGCIVGVCTPDGSRCARVPPGHHVVDVPCTLTSIGIRTCGTVRTIGLGECISNVNIGNCCADICFVPGIVPCTYFLIVTPTTSKCPCLLE